MRNIHIKGQKPSVLSIDEDISDKTEESIQRKVHVAGVEYFINFDGEIQEPREYRQVHELLREVNSNDIIRLVLNTPGGYANTFTHMYTSLMRTPAITIAEVYKASSAGALLALSCDCIDVQEFGYMMIHDMSGGTCGKIGSMEVNVNFYKKWRNGWADKLYKGFLTDKEQDRVRAGEDVYLLKKDIDKRLKKWVPIRRRGSLK